MQVSVNSKAERLKIYKTQAFGGIYIIIVKSGEHEAFETEKVRNFGRMF